MVSGIILAGGKSRRMGTEKGLIRYKGKPMIEYAVDALSPHCDQILISANSSVYNYLGYQVVEDEIPDAGPMGGIYSCLRQSKNDVNFILSCDMPLISDYAISQILASIEGFDIAVPWHGKNYYEPLCAVYRKGLITKFEKSINNGNYKILDFIKEVNANKIDIEKENSLHPDLFFNANSKNDLKQLLQMVQPQEVKKISNLLMIAGTGRKVGKTTFACRIIENIAKNYPVIGIKISPHMHHQDEGQKIIAQSDNYLIIEETSPHTNKDSSRMLRYGASKVYYLQTADRHIEEPFKKILDIIPDNQPVICESGALLNYAKPGLFFVVNRKGQTAFKKGLNRLDYKPDGWVEFDGEGFDLKVMEIQFDARGWWL